MALETAEATKQENAELKTRLTDLERQLQAVQRLLTLKGDTLGALQAGLGEKEAEVAAAQQPAPVAAGATADLSAEVAGAAVTTVPEEKPAAEAAKPKPAPVVQPEPVAETGLLDAIMANPVLLAAAAGGPLLLLLVAMLIRRRRQQAELEEIEGLSGSMAQMEDENELMVATAGAGAAAKSAIAEEEAFGGMAEESVTDYGAASSGMGSIQAEDNEIDPIAEADVYLAYRRYEQAEALLKEAIRNDSGRNELKLKLLEIYFTTKDKDAFEAQAEGLYASLGGQEDELWAQAVEMGREISPEHPLFAEAGGLYPSSDAVAAGAGAAAALGSAAVADEEFSFDKTATSDLGDEFSFDLSDEDLASSLNMPSLEESEIGAGGVLDLDAAEGELESIASLGDADLAAGGDLEELSAADEFSLDDDLSAIGDGEELDLSDLDKLDESESIADDSFNLDDDLIGGDDLGDFDTGLDDLTAGVDLDELSSLEKEDSGAAQGAASNITKSSDSSDKWTIAPAVSSFNSREVKTEMDDGYVPVTKVVTDVVSGHDLDHLSLDETELDLGDDPESNIFDSADDIVGTKLDLARAYIDMGDQNGARSILDEVVKEGDESHRQEAEQLMRQIS
jgi:pilus assembly protein FimV